VCSKGLSTRVRVRLDGRPWPRIRAALVTRKRAGRRRLLESSSTARAAARGARGPRPRYKPRPTSPIALSFRAQIRDAEVGVTYVGDARHECSAPLSEPDRRRHRSLHSQMPRRRARAAVGRARPASRSSRGSSRPRSTRTRNGASSCPVHERRRTKARARASRESSPASVR
jgi:hypothetical protein